MLTLLGMLDSPLRRWLWSSHQSSYSESVPGVNFLSALPLSDSFRLPGALSISLCFYIPLCSWEEKRINLDSVVAVSGKEKKEGSLSNPILALGVTNHPELSHHSCTLRSLSYSLSPLVYLTLPVFFLTLSFEVQRIFFVLSFSPPKTHPVKTVSLPCVKQTATNVWKSKNTR